MRPALRLLGAGRVAGFPVGVAGVGQAQHRQPVVTGGEHSAQGGQVGFGFDQFPRCHQQYLGLEMAQTFQPQSLGLVEQPGIGKGTVELIVVVDPEQGEDLVDRVDQLGCRELSFIRPSCGRRVLRGGREISYCLCGQVFAGFHAGYPFLGSSRPTGV